MTYLIPGKTFLLGEYSALVGGSVLGLATAPGFSVSYSTAPAGEFSFSHNSPAGLLWNSKSDDLSNIKINFEDHYNGAGGFGKSTAEYLSVLLPRLIETSPSYAEIEKNYKSHSKASGAEASGKDLAIQYFGKVMHFDQHTNLHSSGIWRFPELEFFLLSTGVKVPTHEHLRTLDLSKIAHFVEKSEAGINAYMHGSSSEFLNSVKEWSGFLDAEGLLAPAAKQIKMDLESDPDILCAKPCGAMGADVIIVFCHEEKKQSVKSKLLNKNFQVQGSTKDLIAGLAEQMASLKKPLVRGLHVD